MSRNNANRKISTKVIVRITTASLMIPGWFIATVSGFFIWFMPEGQRSGKYVFFYLTKHVWSDIHAWVSLAAVLLTLIHLAIVWRALRGYYKYLTAIARNSVQSNEGRQTQPDVS